MPALTHPRRTIQGVPTHRLHADERRAEVIEAAVKAFASGGLAGTSTEEVARLAGVSQPYLFRLFGSKQQLFIAAVGRMFERIQDAFETAPPHPEMDLGGYDPKLAALGLAYGRLLEDRSLLRLQLQAFAACDDPVVRDFVRTRFAGLVQRVSELTGKRPSELRDFFSDGMLLMAAAAMDLTEADVAWQRICEGGSA
ncbi:MAG TPA: helix-turn-helix domain-containing protein [Candidatus Dormibacteraeota bacterium]|nr:helix-turn-helix domain-containing protein [Candidatus Dormibacteraeota bacterium]